MRSDQLEVLGSGGHRVNHVVVVVVGEDTDLEEPTGFVWSDDHGELGLVRDGDRSHGVLECVAYVVIEDLMLVGTWKDLRGDNSSCRQVGWQRSGITRHERRRPPNRGSQPAPSAATHDALSWGGSTVSTVATHSDITEVACEVVHASITNRLPKLDRDARLLSSLRAALGQCACQQDAHRRSGLADLGLQRWKSARVSDEQLDRRGRFIDILKHEGVRHNLVTIAATCL